MTTEDAQLIAAAIVVGSAIIAWAISDGFTRLRARIAEMDATIRDKR